jgi:serine/threonine protein kinase/sugar lactone lactonase YvrE/tetratricopeptide (TPR) repeat protein
VLLLGAYRPLQRGQTLAEGRYTVQRPLSKGAMGAIYLVTDHGAFDRTVVIKAMLDGPDPDNPEEARAAHERFVEEARTLSTLKHPTIPQIFTYFQDAGHNYIVMEYIEGSDLEQHLTHLDESSGTRRPGRPYLFQDVLRWGIALCQVLEYLASRQPAPVIHHDIKPANLVLDSHSNTIRLVDFGTAKARLLFQPDGTVGLQKTSAFGTQGYAPPEQYRGESEPRSDVYALAATLYHLITDDDPGSHPFEFPRLAMLGKLGSALAAALHQDVTQRPDAATLRQQLEAILAPANARTIQAPDGTLLANESDLAQWCEQNRERAASWLYTRLPAQVAVVWGKTKLADDFNSLTREFSSNQQMGLDAVLAELDPDDFGAARPRLSVEPRALDYGALAVGAHAEHTVQLTNSGRRYIQAQLQLPAWLTAPDLAPDQPLGIVPGATTSVRLVTDMDKARMGGRLRDTVHISHEERTLARIPASATVSRWRTLWQRYPGQITLGLLTLLLVCLVAGLWGYYDYTARQHYELGTAALASEDWDIARAELAQIPDYRDADTLLKESYYHPARAALEAGQWERARRDLNALLALDPDYSDAETLLKETYYRPAQQALARRDWDTARRELAQIPDYRDASVLVLESYYHAGLYALHRGDWSTARDELGQVLDYRDAATLYRESYYNAGVAALDAGDWVAARSEFNQLLALQGDYRDASTLLQESYYRAGVAALERGDWSAARAELAQIPDYRDAETLLKETYYRPALLAIDAQAWDEAADALLALDLLDSDYRDMATLVATNPELLRTIAASRASRWQSGSAEQTRTLSGHSDHVHSLAFSPDGQTLASGSWDHTIKLWRVEDGTLLHTLSGHQRYISGLAFSPDGQTLASGSADGTIRLWRVEDGTLEQIMGDSGNYIFSVALSPDGQTLASAHGNGTIQLWRIADGTLLHTLSGHQNTVESVAFSPDGQTLASGSWDHNVGLWRVEDGALLQTLSGHEWHVSSVAFSPDGQTLASGSWDRTIKLWRVPDGALLHTLTGHGDNVRSVSFSADGQTLASASGGLPGRDTTIKLWHVADGSLLQTLRGHDNQVYSVVFSPDGQTLASASFDRSIKLWQPAP